MIRRVEHRDLADIREISTGIWEDTDYLPAVAAKWIDDPDSAFIGYELDGHLVAVTRNNHLEPGLVWLEGIRVHRDYRGRGIARVLGEHQLEMALASSPERIELATYIDSTESLGLIGSMGFGVVARFKYLELAIDKVAGAPVPWQAVESVEPARVDRWIADLRREKDGYLSFDWTFRRATPELLELLIDRGEVFRTEAGIHVLLTTCHAKDGSITLKILEPTGLEQTVELVQDALQMAANQGARYLIMMNGEEEESTAALLGGKIAITFDDQRVDTFVFRYGSGEKFSLR